MKKQKSGFSLFLIELALIGFCQGGKLCDFAEKFPCKGKHCYNPEGAQINISASQTVNESSKNPESQNVHHCPQNMIFKNCSKKCHQTCEAPGKCQDMVCTTAEDCVCDDGFFIKGSECVPREQCGCYESEAQAVIANGDVYVGINCTRRSNCTNNHLHVEESYRCGDDATCDERSGVRRCYCNNGFEGDGVICTRTFFPKDCHQLYVAGADVDGVYIIFPDGYPAGIQVYCEMKRNDSGWTVIQRRSSSSVDFYRTWKEYKDGFGHPSGDHWLGNDYIHAITGQDTYSLRINLTDSFGSSYYALYSLFSISNDSDKFRLSIGSYSGNAGKDSMKWHNNKQFSTHDHDNDGWKDFNCVEEHRGAWWFGNRLHSKSPFCETLDNLCKNFPAGTFCAVCADSHLNGNYRYNSRILKGTNIFWDFFSGIDCGLQYTNMKVRPTKTQ